MILGRKARNAFRWPSLRLVARPEACTGCLKCTSNCPMGLDVHALVDSGMGSVEHPECILCGTCVDNCAKHTLRYSFSGGSRHPASAGSGQTRSV